MKNKKLVGLISLALLAAMLVAVLSILLYPHPIDGYYSSSRLDSVDDGQDSEFICRIENNREVKVLRRKNGWFNFFAAWDPGFSTTWRYESDGKTSYIKTGRTNLAIIPGFNWLYFDLVDGIPGHQPVRFYRYMLWVRPD